MTDKFDTRYALWWELVTIAFVIVGVFLMFLSKQESELRNLQRRIAVLEQQK